MSREQILGEISRIGREKLDLPGDVRLDQRLVEDLELDSIRLLTLAMEIEDHFEICLDEEDEETIETVGDLVEIVERKRVERQRLERQRDG